MSDESAREMIRENQCMAESLCEQQSIVMLTAVFFKWMSKLYIGMYLVGGFRKSGSVDQASW